MQLHRYDKNKTYIKQITRFPNSKTCNQLQQKIINDQNASKQT